jgi:hypothetical protein
MTLAMGATLRNPVIWGSPIITKLAIIYVIIASLAFCLIWGFADGLFYVFENYYTIKRKNTMIDYAKSAEKRSLSLDMVKEDLEDSVFNAANEEDKKKIYDHVVANLAQSEHEEHPPYKESATTILIDMGLNWGGSPFNIGANYSVLVRALHPNSTLLVMDNSHSPNVHHRSMG